MLQHPQSGTRCWVEIRARTAQIASDCVHLTESRSTCHSCAQSRWYSPRDALGRLLRQQLHAKHVHDGAEAGARQAAGLRLLTLYRHISYIHLLVS
eukprot:2578808-Pleurochrysis_carterae.AAC.1